MSEPQMDQFQRSAQFWSVLVLAAKTQQVLSYQLMERITGLPSRAQSDVLGNIWFYCKQKEFPSLTCLVISQQDGNPTPDDIHKCDVSEEQRRIFVFDWLSQPAPSVEDFRDARKKEAKTDPKVKSA